MPRETTLGRCQPVCLGPTCSLGSPRHTQVATSGFPHQVYTRVVSVRTDQLQLLMRNLTDKRSIHCAVQLFMGSRNYSFKTALCQVGVSPTGTDAALSPKHTGPRGSSAGFSPHLSLRITSSETPAGVHTCH